MRVCLLVLAAVAGLFLFAGRSEAGGVRVGAFRAQAFVAPRVVVRPAFLGFRRAAFVQPFYRQSFAFRSLGYATPLGFRSYGYSQGLGFNAYSAPLGLGYGSCGGADPQQLQLQLELERLRRGY